MKVLLFLNGPEGWQTGIEVGFGHLHAIGMIEALKCFYLDDFSKTEGVESALSTAIDISEGFQPDLIVIFHIGTLPIGNEFISKLKGLASKPILAYDEGDMYGTWAKPVSQSMKTIIKQADVVSLRGLGGIYYQIEKLNGCIVYTPHHADIARFDKEPYLLSERKNKLVLIGNKVKPRITSWIRG